MADDHFFAEACRAANLGDPLGIDSSYPGYGVYELVREYASDLIASAHRAYPDVPPIHFDFLLDAKVNAFAFSYRGEYVVAISGGAVMMIGLVLNHMLANPTVLKRIGNPDSELTSQLPPLSWGTLDFQQLVNEGARALPIKDKGRAAYQSHIMLRALMFLVGHEVAHITRGHLGFLGQSAGTKVIEEAAWHGSTEQQRLERQAIEVDADTRSARTQAGSAHEALKNKPGMQPTWAKEPYSEADAQFDWAFAVNVLFRLFGDRLFTKVDLSCQGYPPLPLRRRIVLQYAEKQLRANLSDGDVEPAVRALFESIEETESAFEAVGAPPSPGGFQNALSKDADEHLRLILETWNRIKPDVSKHSFERLA